MVEDGAPELADGDGLLVALGRVGDAVVVALPGGIGTLAEAATHLATVAPRGEYVVVVEGAPVTAGAAVTDDELRGALDAALAGGADRRTAVATVMAAHRVPKRRVYDIALTIPR